jgi:hypothetical protein
MTDVCPEIIIRTAGPRDEDFSPSVITLSASSNVANLKNIVCNVLEPVLLRLLVCKEEKSVEKPDDCPYPDHKNHDAVRLACGETMTKLAQIYIRHDKINPKARSCLIVFIKGSYLSKTDEVMERLQNSVKWLNIAEEKPYFYIFCYGPPECLLAVTDSCKKIDSKLKEVFPSYSKEESICIPAQVPRHSEALFIKGNGAKFSLSTS